MRSASSMICRDRTPLIFATKPTPQLSCSFDGSYNPCALGSPPWNRFTELAGVPCCRKFLSIALLNRFLPSSVAVGNGDGPEKLELRLAAELAPRVVNTACHRPAGVKNYRSALACLLGRRARLLARPLNRPSYSQTVLMNIPGYETNVTASPTWMTPPSRTRAQMPPWPRIEL